MNQESNLDRIVKRVFIVVVISIIGTCVLTPLISVLSSSTFSQWLEHIEDGLTDPPTWVLEILFLVCGYLMPSILASIFVLKHPDSAWGYPGLTGLAIGFLTNLSIVLVLYYISLNQSSGLASLGLQLKGVDFAGVVFFGLAVCVFSNLFSSLVSRLLFKNNVMDSLQGPHIRMIEKYQATWERILYFFVLTSGLLAEELVFRGYLVFLLGQKTGIMLPFAILSVLLSVVVHLYQGRSLIVHHLVLSAVFAGSVVITKSIWMAIYMHLIQNTVSVIRIWVKAKKTEHVPTSNNL